MSIFSFFRTCRDGYAPKVTLCGSFVLLVRICSRLESPEKLVGVPEQLSNHVPRPGSRFSGNFGGCPGTHRFSSVRSFSSSAVGIGKTTAPIQRRPHRWTLAQGGHLFGFQSGSPFLIRRGFCARACSLSALRTAGSERSGGLGRLRASFSMFAHFFFFLPALLDTLAFGGSLRPRGSTDIDHPEPSFPLPIVATGEKQDG
jgi:hypothetical protein